ncbi:MAG: sialidase family protein [Planctomycetota bacterium]|jgi:hypothetical protein
MGARGVRFGVLVVLLGVCPVSAAITVTGVETWAGGQMHGITPSGSGTPADPYVYVIPDGMILTGTGVIRMDDQYVTFDFSLGTGGLDIAAGGYFDLTGPSRLSDPGTCSIVLGAHSLTGAGDFKTLDISKDSKYVVITGLGDVSINSFYMRTNDAYAGDVSIDAGGSVSVNSIDTQDQATGGNDGGDVTVRGADITIGDIDTRALRTASSDRLSGEVVLQARDYLGTNTLANTVNLYGTINTDSTIGTDGSVTISGVVVTLESGSDVVTGDVSVDIHAGMVQYGKSTGDLFVDNSGGGYSATYDVFWTAAGAEYYASYPRPQYGAEGVDPNVILSWTPAGLATAHDVYFGTSFEDVNNAADANVYPGRGRQDSNSYAPEGYLEFGVTYYWRIDEVVGEGVWRGSVWRFTVDDAKAGHPSPADGASNVPVEVGLNWTPGRFATSHDVYFGTDFNDVNDANSSWPVGSSVYKGGQEANSFEPGSALRLNTTYYWRIDEVGATTFVKGDVWRFKTALARIVGHSIVHGAPDKFCGWPANNGVWTWGDYEILVGFILAQYVEKSGHNTGPPSYTVLGRSLDGGLTWTMEDPPNFVGDGGTPVPSPGGINFAHPDFALRTLSYTSQGQFFFSYDRGHTWQGPYTCGNLMSHPELVGLENSSRTDYVVNGPDDCLIGMSVRDCGPTDRAFMARTTDGGATFNFVSWINPEPCTTRGVMPSTVRISEDKLVTTLRRKYPGEWIDAFVSYDNGGSWSFLAKVTDTYSWNGNPPALVRLADGRLACAYGNRADLRIEARISEDEGATWSDEIILRDDYQTDAYGDPDLGYCRMVERPDGKLVTMYYWATPEHPTHHIGATIWDPGGTADAGAALNPSPKDGAEDVPQDIVLGWVPGLYAASHDVYFGTNFDDVNDASTSSPEYKGSQELEADSYDPAGLLALGTTHYWRIDEANGPELWKGDVWRFTTVDCIVVDDMEQYGDDNPLWYTWSDGAENSTASLIYLGTLAAAPADPVRDGQQSLGYFFDNSGYLGAYYAEAERGIDDPCDWTVFSVKTLKLWFYGDPGNDIAATDEMYVGLEDRRGPGSYAEARYGDTNDVNDITAGEWYEWNINLQSFGDDGLNIEDVNKLYIGFGDRVAPVAGGWGFVYFDDIRLCVGASAYPACWDYLTQCHGDADNTGDVKGSDFLALKESWYKVYPDADYDPCADFDRNGEVKGSDFLILKTNWYQAVDANCPQGGLWPPQL